MANVRKSKLRKIERKRRKEKEKRRADETPSLVYAGNKYRKERYIPFYLATETAIHEADVMSDRTLSDDVVWAALVDLIGALRRGGLPALETLTADERRTFSLLDFLSRNIVVHWEMTPADTPSVGRDARIGILRSILHSIEVWGANRPGSRGYLDYIEGFLHKLGISTRCIAASSAASPLADPRDLLPSLDWDDE